MGVITDADQVALREEPIAFALRARVRPEVDAEALVFPGAGKDVGPAIEREGDIEQKPGTPDGLPLRDQVPRQQAGTERFLQERRHNQAYCRE